MTVGEASASIVRFIRDNPCRSATWLADRIEQDLAEPGPRLSVEFHQHDWIPGFAAFKPGATTPEGRAFCVLNLGDVLSLVDDGDLEKEDIPYIVAETMMHEVIHALEQWAGREFDEDKVEALLTKYRDGRGS